MSGGLVGRHRGRYEIGGRELEGSWQEWGTVKVFGFSLFLKIT